MNRREILRGAGLATAVAGSGQPARAAANDRIGVGLIGSGGQGTADQKSFILKTAVSRWHRRADQCFQ